MARAIALWMSGIIVLALLLELLFQALPVSTSTETGYYVDPLILTYPPKHRWTASTGWDLRNAQALKANNIGFSANRDFTRDSRAVALIGDSFVEASMLPETDRPEAQLSKALRSRPVYAMGSPGTALLDYAERIRYAQREFGVRDFVILMEQGDILQSLCGSGNVNGSCLDPLTLTHRTETLPAPSVLKRVLRHSALAQYLFSQLKLNPKALWNQITKQARPITTFSATKGEATLAGSKIARERTIATVDAVATAFLTVANTNKTGKLIIIMDSDRSGVHGEHVSLDPGRSRFIALARDAGAVVVDTEPIFHEHLAHSRLKLVVGPYDNHMNALAIQLIMNAAAAQLEKQ